MKNFFPQSLLLFIILISIQSCQTKTTPKDEESTLGTIDFPVTGNQEAVPHFEKGVLLLHSFMYKEARESFIKAQEIDEDFAMAYWGEAMTYNHPLWAAQNTEKAIESLVRLDSTKENRLQKAKTPFEQDMLTAVEILYGEGTKFERDDLYAEFMTDLYEKYPDNHEVAAFYALSLLGSVEEGRDYDVYGKGAKVVEGILKENPNHPGALHYLIHSYDDPDHASLAINAANSYSEVAPDAGHALHMPSHIYIALGMWDDVISSNIRSYEARLKKNDATGSTGWNLHAYHWLLYGYLQKNERAKADEIMTRMKAFMESNSSTYANSYAIEMTGIYFAETGDWNEDFSLIGSNENKFNILFRAAKMFIRGYQGYTEGNADVVIEVVRQMNEEIDGASNQLATSGVTVCSGQSFVTRPPNQDDINIARVLSLELQVANALLNKEEDAVVESFLVEATNLQDDISFSFGPPSIIIPSYEMYGNWLLEKNRYQEAMAQFEKSLEKGPGRRKALLGKLTAARGLEDEVLIEELEKLLNLETEVS